jgi:hypothetical protein
VSLKPQSEDWYDYIALVPGDFRRSAGHARKSTSSHPVTLRRGRR